MCSWVSVGLKDKSEEKSRDTLSLNFTSNPTETRGTEEHITSTYRGTDPLRREACAQNLDLHRVEGRSTGTVPWRLSLSWPSPTRLRTVTPSEIIGLCTSTPGRNSRRTSWETSEVLTYGASRKDQSSFLVRYLTRTQINLESKFSWRTEKGVSLSV